MSIDDGGSAFPEAICSDVSKLYGPGFEDAHNAGEFSGMTLLDWFAGKALPGLIGLESDADLDGIAHDAYLYAEAMIRQKRLREIV